MATVEERVDSLETKFAEFMARLDHHIERLDRNIERLDRNIERLDRNYEELKREARQHTLEWAQLAERFGRFAEDIVAPNIPRLGREVFGIAEPEFSAQRVEKAHIKDASRFREFDLIYAGQGKIIVVETKATARVKYIEDFAETVGDLADFFPNFRQYSVIPIFASLALSSDFVRRLSRLRIYGLALGERTMELVNLAEVSTRRR
jgi:exonuclease VII small subunit